MEVTNWNAGTLHGLSWPHLIPTFCNRFFRLCTLRMFFSTFGVMLVADPSSKTRGQGNWNRINEAQSDMEVIASSVLCSAWGIWGIWVWTSWEGVDYRTQEWTDWSWLMRGLGSSSTFCMGLFGRWLQRQIEVQTIIHRHRRKEEGLTISM